MEGPPNPLTSGDGTLPFKPKEQDKLVKLYIGKKRQTHEDSGKWKQHLNRTYKTPTSQFSEEDM